MKVLVLNPDVNLINDVAKNLEKALKAQKIEAKLKSVSQDISDGKFRDSEEYKPGLLIVFDNKLLGYAIKASESKEFKNIPVISVMSLNLKQTIASNKNATGVAYEIPPFLLIDSFNRFLKKRIDKVAVIYREGLFDWYIEEAKKQLEYSKVTLIAEAIPKDTNANDVEKLLASAFKRFKKEKADAFWLITDNAIINQATMKNLKELTNNLRMPFLCGVKNLVTKEFDLCTFSSLPDDEVVVEQSLEQTLAIVDKNQLHTILKWSI